MKRKGDHLNIFIEVELSSQPWNLIPGNKINNVSFMTHFYGHCDWLAPSMVTCKGIYVVLC